LSPRTLDGDKRALCALVILSKTARDGFHQKADISQLVIGARWLNGITTCVVRLNSMWAETPRHAKPPITKRGRIILSGYLPPTPKQSLGRREVTELLKAQDFVLLRELLGTRARVYAVARGVHAPCTLGTRYIVYITHRTSIRPGLPMDWCEERLSHWQRELLDTSEHFSARKAVRNRETDSPLQKAKALSIELA
jgi:hypothetical protein